MIEPTIPSFPTLRAVDQAAAPAEPVAPRVHATGAPEFARVFEMEEARRRRAGIDAIPEAVHADLARAADLVDELYRTGHSVRFNTHVLTGRIVADLVGPDGGVVRRLPLTELVGHLDPEPAA